MSARCIWHSASVGADIIRPFYQGRNGCVGISPAGEFLLQRCKRNQKTAGGGSRAFSMPYPASPGPPVFSTGGATKGRSCIHPARAKDRIPLLAPPAAAPCYLNKYLLLQERSRLVFRPRGAGRWSLLLRGWWRMRKAAVNTHQFQVCIRQRFRQPRAHSGAGPSGLPSPGGYIQ